MDTLTARPYHRPDRGLSGETEEEFQQTLTFLHRCAFAAMHIFPYSKRPDTPAAKMPGQVLNAVKEERARRAAETAAEMEHTYLSQWVGQTVPVLFEEEQGGLWAGPYRPLLRCGRSQSPGSSQLPGAGTAGGAGGEHPQGGGPVRGIRRIPCGNVNCYLVQGEEGAVLVDTGYTGYVERLLDTCLGAGVRLIVLTHGHLDHIQNTALLMERLGVPAALHPADLGLLTDQQSQPLSAQGPAGRLLLSLSRHSFQTQAFLPFTPTVELREGTAWPLGCGRPGSGAAPAIRRAPSAWTWRGTPSL